MIGKHGRRMCFEKLKMHHALLETVSLSIFRLLKKTYTIENRTRSPCYYLNIITHRKLDKIK